MPVQALEDLERVVSIPKKAITNHKVLNEAFAYSKPSSFSRGLAD